MEAAGCLVMEEDFGTGRVDGMSQLLEDVRCPRASIRPPLFVGRPPAGPSLSGRTGHSKRLDLRVDDDTYRAIRHIADQGNRRVSDVVRDAIRRYLEAS